MSKHPLFSVQAKEKQRALLSLSSLVLEFYPTHTRDEVCIGKFYSLKYNIVCKSWNILSWVTYCVLFTFRARNITGILCSMQCYATMLGRSIVFARVSKELPPGDSVSWAFRIQLSGPSGYSWTISLFLSSPRLVCQNILFMDPGWASSYFWKKCCTQVCRCFPKPDLVT